MRSARSVVSNVSRASAMLATDTSSTNTCGASSTSPVTGCSLGVDQRDRAAVAVADQDRALDPVRREQRREHLQRLVVHEVRPARHVRDVGLPVARARVDQRPAPGRLRRSRREVAPQRDRAEPLVQEHERRLGARRSPRSRASPHGLQPAAQRRHRRAPPDPAPTTPRRARPPRGSPPRPKPRARRRAGSECRSRRASARRAARARCPAAGRAPIVEDLQQRELAGREDHALQDHVVDADGLGPGRARPPRAAAPRTAPRTRRTRVRAGRRARRLCA